MLIFEIRYNLYLVLNFVNSCLLNFSHFKLIFKHQLIDLGVLFGQIPIRISFSSYRKATTTLINSFWYFQLHWIRVRFKYGSTLIFYLTLKFGSRIRSLGQRHLSNRFWLLRCRVFWVYGSFIDSVEFRILNLGNGLLSFS